MVAGFGSKAIFSTNIANELINYGNNVGQASLPLRLKAYLKKLIITKLFN